MEKRNSVQSIERVLDILECFADIKSEWGLVELSVKLDLAPSTTHRLLTTLINRGYVEQDTNLKKYKIGSRLLRTAGSILNKYSLRSIARPFLVQLSQQTGETVHLCILSGYKAFYLDKIESPKSITTNSSIGTTLSAHVSGVGKVLLAHLPEESLNEFFTTVKLEKFTKNSITDSRQLKEHLKKVREQGYAIDNEETEDQLVCVAAPIFDLDNKVIAAVSISGPAYRLKPKIENYIPLIKKITLSISEMLGYRNTTL